MVRPERGKAKMYGICFAVLLLAVLIVFGGFLLFGGKKYHYSRVDEVFYNPLMGFAPNADNPDAVAENTLVYVDVTWRELEPEEGVYDFDGIRKDNALEKWQSQGKHVVFRFICDIPGDTEHMDIPDWLYEKTKDGMFYDSDYGKGYSPEYDNETFISSHEKAIEALGGEFGKDTFFAYIELGSLGHWGEWHVKYDEGMPRIPGEETCEKYIAPYLAAFPNAKVLMRRPFSWVSTDDLGVFNDMTGDPEDTKKWLSWIEEGGTYTEPKTPHTLSPCPDVYKNSPIGGEFTSGISMEEMLSKELERTITLIRDSHMTFIGPKCPTQEEWKNWQMGTASVLKNVGYRYGIDKANIKRNKVKGTISVNLKLNNYGVAPMYQNWSLYLYQIDENDAIIKKEKLSVNISDILGGGSSMFGLVTEAAPQNKTDDIRIGVGIENPETGIPEVTFDMDVECIGKIALLEN